MPSHKHSGEGRSRMMLVAMVVVSYWITAMAMVFINKELISGHNSGVDISVFIVWVQTLIGITSVVLLRLVSSYLNLKWDLPLFQPNSLLHQDMVLASMLFTGTLIFNNLMLKYISVAFYQLARSLTLIFVILFSGIVLGEKISWRVICSCFLIVFGFYIGVDEEIFAQGLHVLGVIYGIAASLTAALCGVFYKRVQIRENPTSLQMTFNNQFISFVALSPLLYSTSQLTDFLQSPLAGNPTVTLLLMLSGFASVLMGWVSARLISLTSPLTHNISINTKSVLQTLLAVLWSGETRSFSWWLGNALVMGGIGTYTANKLNMSSVETETSKPRSSIQREGFPLGQVTATGTGESSSSQVGVNANR
ncbi:GDP-fucose transporter 1 [Elysia marginata]|uniref:GDP-fucose transporter 1 n=1 Tax=Elysia marginata TaxID=1093978 RepID=A0AAV4JUT8_9GAST|nr:GDP-fucose transporter 1 [Elysia marginata]